jgi:hypothetical protein
VFWKRKHAAGGCLRQGEVPLLRISHGPDRITASRVFVPLNLPCCLYTRLQEIEICLKFLRAAVVSKVICGGVQDSDTETRISSL